MSCDPKGSDGLAGDLCGTRGQCAAVAPSMTSQPSSPGILSAISWPYRPARQSPAVVFSRAFDRGDTIRSAPQRDTSGVGVRLLAGAEGRDRCSLIAHGTGRALVVRLRCVEIGCDGVVTFAPSPFLYAPPRSFWLRGGNRCLQKARASATMTLHDLRGPACQSEARVAVSAQHAASNNRLRSGQNPITGREFAALLRC